MRRYLLALMLAAVLMSVAMKCSFRTVSSSGDRFSKTGITKAQAAKAENRAWAARYWDASGL